MESKKHTVKEALTPVQWLELVEVADSERLRSELRNQHPADLAAIIEQVPFDLQLQLLKLLSEDAVAEVIAELEDNTQARLLRRFPTNKVAKIIENLESDDAADLLAVIEEDQVEDILSQLPDEERVDLVELLNYDEESAGGIMAKEAAAVSSSITVSEVVQQLREEFSDIDDIYYVYLINNDNKLEGVVSLKDLILAKPDEIVSDIVVEEIPFVNVNMDREDVAAVIRKYDLVSAPVVDDNGVFLGRVTHDDILDVVHEEVEEDIARLTGHGEFDPGERSVFRNLQNRLPWLLIGLVGGIFAAGMLAAFEKQLSRTTTLIFFLPLVAAMGGNAGIQTSALMVRGLATGEISEFGQFARLIREIALALLTGLICAIFVFTITYYWRDDLLLASVVSVSLLIVIVSSALVGVVIPLSLNRIGIDPAIATGPFITTSNDVIGLFIYLGIAHLFFEWFNFI